MTEAETPKPVDDAPEPAAAPAPEPVAEKAAPWSAIMVALALIAAVGGAVVTWPDWKHLVIPAKMARNAAPAPAAAPDETAQLRAELAALSDRLRAVENRPAGAGGGGGAVEARLAQHDAALKALQSQPQVPTRLTDEVDSLGKAVAELKKTSADAAAVLRLADRVEKVEAEMRDIQARRTSAAALMLAVGQLREALARAMPFDAELRAVKALAAQDTELASALEVLKARSVAGIPTFPTLAGRFHALVPAIVRADVLPAGQSWWRQTLDRLATLVTIRREDGDAAGASAAAIVARAEARLAEGDLAGAAGEVARLSGGPAETAAPWLADARARLDADKAVSELSAHVVAQAGARQ